MKSFEKNAQVKLESILRSENTVETINIEQLFDWGKNEQSLQNNAIIDEIVATANIECGVSLVALVTLIFCNL